MDTMTRSNVFSVEAVNGMMKEVIQEEESRYILQANLIRMEYLLPYITIYLQDQLPEAVPEVLKVWLQLLHNCLTHAKSIIRRSTSRQRCLDCLSNNPGRASAQIENWRLHFNYLFQTLESEFSVFVRGREAVVAPVIAPILPLMKDVIEEEENRQILKTELRAVDNLLVDISVVFQDQRKAAPESLKIWLQLLQNSVREANTILHTYCPSQRQRRRLVCLKGNPLRTSQQVKEWKVLFNFLFQGLQQGFSMFVTSTSHLIINENPIQFESEIIEETIEGQPLSADEAEESVRPLSKDKTEVSKDEVQESGQPPSKDDEADIIFIYKAEGSADEAEESTDEAEESTDEAEQLERPLSKDEAEESMDETEGSIDEGEGSTDEAEPLSKDEAQESGRPPSKDEAEISTYKAEESLDAVAEAYTEEREGSTDETERLEQRISKDAAWMLFRTIAFKDNAAPVDIEECAKNIVDECQGFLLAITLVAAAMRGKNRVAEWETSLSSIKSHADSSSRPDTMNPQLYPLLRWSYDALPNSDVKNCFLYCAMYPKDEEINVQELVEMWVAEGLVRSKQKSHLMDMANGRSYVNLLVDRYFFQNAISDAGIIDVWMFPEAQSIRVDHVVHEMAVYISEQEENCLFKTGQRLQNFPVIHNWDCKRISLINNDIKNLPAQFPCPKLVSLSLCDSIEEVPPGFLISLTSLKVLHLQYIRINSIPSSVGQLKQLEFLRLRGLDSIQDLPEGIGHLSSLQFLYINCDLLQSLPSKIGELKNLKCLSLFGCNGLKVVPNEISQLTSLTTLDAPGVEFNMKAESEASIWILKGLRNLTTLRTKVKVTRSSATIEEGIMGTWLEMRHLDLEFLGADDDDVMVDFPRDMKKMSKLQLFSIRGYRGSSLRDYICKFQHLEVIALGKCQQLRELLSQLEAVPNLKDLSLTDCAGLSELGIGKSPGFLMLEILVLMDLQNLESIGGASNNGGVWNESTLPRLRILAISGCPKLKKLPVGMDKLPNLVTVLGNEDWWQQIIWEDDSMKIRLQKLFKQW